MVEERPVLKN